MMYRLKSDSLAMGDLYVVPRVLGKYSMGIQDIGPSRAAMLANMLTTDADYSTAYRF